jgi:hypothetical protein
MKIPENIQNILIYVLVNPYTIAMIIILGIAIYMKCAW